MATKAQLQAKIDAIADGEENTAEEIREFANGLLNEIYKQPFYETEVSEIFTARIPNSVNYALNFKKTGNSVLVFGTITIIAPFNTLPNQDLIAFLDTELNPSDSFIQKTMQNGKIFRFNNGKITAVSGLETGTYYINFTYVTD